MQIELACIDLNSSPSTASLLLNARVPGRLPQRIPGNSGGQVVDEDVKQEGSQDRALWDTISQSA